MNHDHHPFFAICAPGLETIVASELSELGIDGRVVPGGVEFAGDDASAYRVNLRAGTVLRVLQRVAVFSARRFPVFIDAVEAVEWKRWLRVGQGVNIKATARRSRLYHTGALIERAQAAMARSLGCTEAELLGGPEENSLAVQIRFDADHCTVSIDLSGELLSKRGAYGGVGKAPLRSDLARALVLMSGWRGEGALVDPFVGSGTILREAHSIATGAAPGRHRSFAFQRQPNFDSAIWKRELAAADEATKVVADLRLFGSDRDKGAIEAALENLSRSGVPADLRCANVSASVLADGAAEPIGAVVSNPPFGHRVKGGDLRPLYQTFGRLLAENDTRAVDGKLAVGMVSADLALVRATGIDLPQQIMTDHGGVKVYLCARSRS